MRPPGALERPGGAKVGRHLGSATWRCHPKATSPTLAAGGAPTDRVSNFNEGEEQMSIPFGTRPFRPRRRAPSHVKVCDQSPAVDCLSRRRAIVRIAGRVVALPAAGLLLVDPPGDAEAAPFSQSRLASGHRSGSGKGHAPAAPSSRASPIVRDFADPFIELVRLLR